VVLGALTFIALGSVPSITLSAGASASGHVHSKAPCSAASNASPSIPGSTGVAGAPLTITASTAEVGCIDLLVTGAVAPSVSIVEVTQGVSADTPIAVLSTRDGQASQANGVTWLCNRLTRSFEVSETLPDGSRQSATTSVTTPSCASRVSVSIPATRLHRGYPVTVALTDRWHLGGLRVQGCQHGGRPRSCPAVTLKAGHAATPLRLRVRSAGRPMLDVSDPYQKLHLRLRVLAARPVLLATGDSEMQVLDEMFGSDLSGSAGMRVVGDARQSTAISSPFFFDWPAHAVGQVGGLRPDVVAMFLGGNEGFRLGRAECCGADWSRQYAARVAGMMRVYLQHGAAAVYWFLIPTPSSEPFVRVTRAVNRGIEIAAAEFREGVHVFDLRPVFSPGGRYIDSLTHDGRTITVHESDGFHLSASADVIVAQMFIQRLRRDGLLP
jgi:hypothetical protein